MVTLDVGGGDFVTFTMEYLHGKYPSSKNDHFAKI
jgi:hypothetical protein